MAMAKYFFYQSTYDSNLINKIFQSIFYFMEQQSSQSNKSNSTHINDIPSPYQLYRAKLLKQQLTKKEEYRQANKKKTNKKRDFAGSFFQRIMYIQRQKAKAPKNLIGRIKIKQPQTQNHIVQIDLGTCLLINYKFAIASAHQLYKFNQKIKKITSKSQFYVKFPSLFKQEQIEIQYYQICEDYIKNPIVENDYSFIRVKLSIQQKKMIQQSLKTIKFVENHQLEDYDNFKFKKGKICGFMKHCPQQLTTLQTQVSKFESLLSQSQSQVLFNGKYFEYKAYTVNGMSGSPIFIQVNSQLIIIGIHIKGNYYQQKNCGLIFNQSFYRKLDHLSKLTQLEEQQTRGRNQILDFISNNLSSVQKVSVKEHLYIKETFKNRCNTIKRQRSLEKQSQMLFQIIKSIIKSLEQLQQKSIYIQYLNEDNIYFQVSGQSAKQNLSFQNLSLRYNYLQKYQMWEYYNNLTLLRYFIASNQFINKIKSKLLLYEKNAKLLSIINNIQQIASLSELAKLYWKKDKIQYKKTIQSTTIQPYLSRELNHFFIMEQYFLQNRQSRIQSFKLLIKYSKKNMTKKSFLRIYMIIVIDIYANIKNRLKVLKQLLQTQNQVQKTGIKQQDKGAFSTLKDKYQQLIGLTQKIQKISPPPLKESSQYQQFYKQNYPFIDKYLNQANKQMVERIVYYEFIFIVNIYQNELKKILQQLKSIISSPQKRNVILKLYKAKIDQPVLNEIQFQNNLYLYDDNLSQNPKDTNHNYEAESAFQVLGQQSHKKTKQSKLKIDYRQFQILNNIFSSDECDYNYSLKDVDLQNKYKYLQYFNLLVEIQKDNRTIATGCIIGNSMVCTAQHSFDKEDIRNQLRPNLSSYRIKYQNTQYQIHQIYKTGTEIKQFHDIILLQIKQSPFLKVEKLPIFDFHKNYQINWQNKLFTVVCGFGRSKKDLKKIVYKQSFQHIILNDENFKHNYYISLLGQQICSGSPIIIRSSTGEHLILGFYLGQDIDSSFQKGRYSKFSSSFFDKNIRGNIFKPLRLDQYQSFFDKELFFLYIKQKYGTIDHFLLRVMAEILKLNHHNIYIKELTINNLILYRFENRNIIFSNLQRFTLNDALKQFQDSLNSDKSEKRKQMAKLIQYCEKVNINAVFAFITQVHQFFKSKPQSNQSKIFNLFLDNGGYNQNYPSLYSAIDFLDKNFALQQLRFSSQDLQQYVIINSNDRKRAYQKIQQEPYRDIQFRQFHHKPAKRFQKIRICYQLLKYPYKKKIQREQRDKNSQLQKFIKSIIQNKYRLVNIKRYFKSRLNLIKDLPKYGQQVSHFNMLYSYFHRQLQEFVNLEVKESEGKNQFKNGLLQITSACLQQNIVRIFQDYQTLQRATTFKIIKRWKNLEDYLEELSCIQQLQRINKEIA